MFRADLKLDKDIATIVFFGNAADIKPGIIPEVRKALDGNVRIILLDMSSVQHIDAEGVQTFADTIRYVHRREGKIFLTDMQPQVMRMVFMNQQGVTLPMFSTMRDAKREIGFQRVGEYRPPKMNILVIENATPISRDLGGIFGAKRLWYTYKLKATTIGKEAHNMVKEINPNAILMDATVGTNDGVTFIEWLKSDFIYWYIPVIIITEEGMVRKALHFIQNGADDLLFYPFRPEEVSPRLQFAIQMNNLVKREKERQANAEQESHL